MSIYLVILRYCFVQSYRVVIFIHYIPYLPKPKVKSGFIVSAWAYNFRSHTAHQIHSCMMLFCWSIPMLAAQQIAMHYQMVKRQRILHTYRCRALVVHSRILGVISFTLYLHTNTYTHYSEHIHHTFTHTILIPNNIA